MNGTKRPSFHCIVITLLEAQGEVNESWEERKACYIIGNMQKSSARFPEAPSPKIEDMLQKDPKRPKVVQNGSITEKITLDGIELRTHVHQITSPPHMVPGPYQVKDH